MLDHTCPHGFQLDVTIATRQDLKQPSQRILLCSESGVNEHDLSSTHRRGLHKRIDTHIDEVYLDWLHQYALTRILMKPIQIVEVVYSVIEKGLAAIAALYQMKGDVR